MEALYVLLIFSLVLGVGFLAAFFFAHSRGQFEDSETPAMRMLFDDYDLRKQGANALITNTDRAKKSDASAVPTVDTVRAKANI
ncbi:MAG: cbb3-type cytochrome oxidase assembly protein CcoS [Turneriella sp.]